MLCNIACLHPYSFYFTARMLLGWLFTARLDGTLTTHFDGSLRSWVSGNHAKSIRIPMSFQYLKKKVAQRSPTGVKMIPKTTSPTPNRCLADKSEILQKPLYLQWFKHIQPLHSGNISLPGSPKRWTWKLSPTLTSQITEN